jgi:hypothetical protein
MEKELLISQTTKYNMRVRRTGKTISVTRKVVMNRDTMDDDYSN